LKEQDTFFIETYGCTSNKADSYIIASVLRKANYVETALDSARFIIINTCAVKQQTENKIKQRLKELHELYREESDRFIVIAGCLPHITPKYIDIIKKIIPNYSAIIDLDIIDKIQEIFEEIKKGKRNLVFLSEEPIDKAKFLINYPPNKITGIIPISEGCLGSCTYCCVKNARGKLNCFDPQEIIRNVEHQLKQGIKQIFLTSQDCSIYKFDDFELQNLLKEICELNYKFFLRIGMINPSFLTKNTRDLIEIFGYLPVYKFLHIPIQSGSDDVLRDMLRTYQMSEIKEKIRELREYLPKLTISTDIICGFPTETEEDFNKTLDLIKWLKPEILNISKFTPRPGTKAKEMKQLDSMIIKDRSIKLSNLFRESLVNINEKWNDWEGEVLILHKGTKPNQVFGRNIGYKNIFIDEYKGEVGKFVNVKIKKIEGFSLFGELL